MTVQQSVAIVTGASSGIGYKVAETLVKQGYKVYGISRRGTAPAGAVPLRADVSVKAEIDKAIAFAIAEAGKIDMLIANAGMGISGPIEFAEQAAMDKIMSVDFYGQVYCARAVLKQMREQNFGKIVFVSSVAAAIAIPYQAFYSAAKAAVCSVALALRNEVKSFNIKVSCVQPGDCATGFTDAREKDEAHDDVYTQNRKATASMEKDERSGMSPESAAKEIVKIAQKKHPKPIYIIGFKYKLFALLFRLLPGRLSYAIVGKMYG